MRLIVHDLIAELAPWFLSTASPKEKFAKAQRAILDPASGVAARMWSANDAPEYAAMSAALQDGYDVVAAQQVWGLFNPARSMAATVWQFEQYAEAHLAKIAREAWDRCAEKRPMEMDVDLFLLPGDAANRTFMMHNLGVSAYAQVEGDRAQIRVAIWPSKHNIATFPEVIARMYAHVASVQPLSLGAFIERERIANEFCESSWIDRKVRDLAAWPATLEELASVCGVAQAAGLPVNVYGSRGTLGELAAFWSGLAPLTAEEIDYSREILRQAWQSSHPNTVAAHFYGDPVVSAHGIKGVGLPAFVGFQMASVNPRAISAVL